MPVPAAPPTEQSTVVSGLAEQPAQQERWDTRELGALRADLSVAGLELGESGVAPALMAAGAKVV